MRIVLLEDDEVQAQMTSQWLTEAGYQCTVFHRAKPLLINLARETYDLVLLDWLVPDLSGEDVLKALRNSVRPTSPVMFITARDSEDDIASMLYLGADDYLTKPVHKRELLARVYALLRRAKRGAMMPETIDCGPYRINVRDMKVELHGELVDLTQREAELAIFLFSRVGELVSRGHIMQAVWNDSSDKLTRTIDTHISRIRQKLKLGYDTGYQLRHVYSLGYRLEQIHGNSPREAASHQGDAA
jgi:DNA-binding response OmpR family regulator